MASFLERRGFTGDPFASTNAENEESLASYFIPPPYFERVLGMPSDPKSTIVFAPRGSGKTAQRRMVELNSMSPASRYCCVTYTDFSGLLTGTPSLSDHLLALNKLLTLAILSELETSADLAKQLSQHEKQIVKYCASALLSNLSAQELENGLNSVKSLGDKAADKWHKYGGVASVAISAVLKKIGIDGVSVPAELASKRDDVAGLAGYLFPQLVATLVSLGYKAVYILIDKVDETRGTSNSPERAFDLISSLVLDLNTMDQAKVAFKFFLWDQMHEFYTEGGGRPDRIMISELRWTEDELKLMMSRRVASYTEGDITSFNTLMDPECYIDVDRLLALLNPDSPRDMIRMANRIVGEHTRQSDTDDSISEEDLFRGIYEFSKERAYELYGRYMKDLQRLPGPIFNMNRLASDVFKISATAVRNKVVAWSDAGAVKKVSEVASGARPIHIYTVQDPRLLIATSPATQTRTCLSEKMFICAQCKRVKISDSQTSTCPDCGGNDPVGQNDSLLRLCTR